METSRVHCVTELSRRKVNWKCTCLYILMKILLSVMSANVHSLIRTVCVSIFCIMEEVEKVRFHVVEKAQTESGQIIVM